MHTDTSTHTSYRFVLRLWLEELGDGRSEWRGQLQSMSSGEVRYFREWQKLVECLTEMLSQPKSGNEE